MGSAVTSVSVGDEVAGKAISLGSKAIFFLLLGETSVSLRRRISLLIN